MSQRLAISLRGSLPGSPVSGSASPCFFEIVLNLSPEAKACILHELSQGLRGAASRRHSQRLACPDALAHGLLPPRIPQKHLSLWARPAWCSPSWLNIRVPWGALSNSRSQNPPPRLPESDPPAPVPVS